MVHSSLTIPLFFPHFRHTYFPSNTHTCLYIRHTLAHYSFHSLLRKASEIQEKKKREESIHYQMAPCRAMVVLCLVLFLAASGTSARVGITTMEVKNRKSLGFKHSYIFGYLPKGVPIPPSGPSKRHNSLVDSLPH